MLTIDGWEVTPSPETYQVTINEIVKAERNAAGTLSKEHIAGKRKIELSFKLLTDRELNRLMGSVYRNSMYVEYVDSYGGNGSGTFYAGDKSAVMVYDGENRMWKDVKFNLVEF